MRNQVVFEELYREHYPYIKGFVVNALRDAEISEEIVQDTFYEASRHIDSLRVHPNVRGWLITTARYNILDELKASKDRVIYLEDISFVPHETLGMADEGSLRDKLRIVLTEDDADILVLHYECGYPVSEIAKRYGITVNACKVRMHRARMKLKREHIRVFHLIVLICTLMTSRFVWVLVGGLGYGR